MAAGVSRVMAAGVSCNVIELDEMYLGPGWPGEAADLLSTL